MTKKKRIIVSLSDKAYSDLCAGKSLGLTYSEAVTTLIEKYFCKHFGIFYSNLPVDK